MPEVVISLSSNFCVLWNDMLEILEFIPLLEGSWSLVDAWCSFFFIYHHLKGERQTIIMTPQLCLQLQYSWRYYGHSQIGQLALCRIADTDMCQTLMSLVAIATQRSVSPGTTTTTLFSCYVPVIILPLANSVHVGWCLNGLCSHNIVQKMCDSCTGLFTRVCCMQLGNLELRSWCTVFEWQWLSCNTGPWIVLIEQRGHQKSLPDISLTDGCGPNSSVRDRSIYVLLRCATCIWCSCLFVLTNTEISSGLFLSTGSFVFIWYFTEILAVSTALWALWALWAMSTVGCERYGLCLLHWFPIYWCIDTGQCTGICCKYVMTRIWLIA